MKFLKYQIIISGKPVEETERPIEPVLSEKTIPYSIENEEIAKAEAYNGEYTIEDDGKPEPVIPPTNAELAAENKLLKQQVSALTSQQSFYEDCIAEMATVVYA